jgi:hypothetical protein
MPTAVSLSGGEWLLPFSCESHIKYFLTYLGLFLFLDGLDSRECGWFQQFSTGDHVIFQPDVLRCPSLLPPLFFCFGGWFSSPPLPLSSFFEPPLQQHLSLSSRSWYFFNNSPILTFLSLLKSLLLFLRVPFDSLWLVFGGQETR